MSTTLYEGQDTIMKWAEKWDGGTKEGFGAACRDFFFFWIPDTSIKDMARLLMC